MKNYKFLYMVPLLLFIGCNKENSKKVYRQFDSIDITEVKSSIETASAFEGGIGFDLNRLVLQGVFLAPQIVAEALIGAALVSSVFHEFGFDVLPKPGSYRSDVIQAVQIGNPEALKIICRSFQQMSPVDSYLDPVPASMPGYQNDLVMAGGTFIDGSTSEFSSDSPLIPPFNLFVQGGTHRTHVEIALIKALSELIKAGFIKLPQNT